MSPPRSARIRPAGPASVALAAQALREGTLVVFPTETVYGLGASARNDEAVAEIFALKQRPRFNPLIVHVLSRADAEELAVFNPKASALAEIFWPGGLTLVLPRREGCPLSLLVSAGLDSVALRAPAHPIARALLEEAGTPIAAPSANRSGRISPTTAEAVAEELGDAALILDGGPCAIGLESTVVGFYGNEAVLLRPGAVSRHLIEAVVGPLGKPPAAIVAPGMMESHYAPGADLRLNATKVSPGEALLAFGTPPLRGATFECNLSPRGDVKEAAANLFSMLRALDATGAATIAVMPVPTHGLGEAINDRLLRASAPRPSPLL
jgi:L-threonylcarbamoyladenylate synthase